MQKKIFSLFLSLLVVTALAALAQSPTTSAPPGNNSTQEPYGATLDHPNPNSGSSTATSSNTASSTASDPSATSPSATNSNGSSTPTDNNSSSATSTSSSTGTDPSSTAASNSTLPRTASDLPLLLVLALAALGGAFLVRTAAKRAA